jgi:type II secretory pathway pseudopilin PulG
VQQLLNLERRRRVRRHGGMTMGELVLVLGILGMAFGMLTSTLVATARQRHINRETALAVEAARDIFERMRDADFDQLFALYNAQAADDPGGAGTAPGNVFDVDELKLPPGSPRPAVGEIVLPAQQTEIGTWQLREDALDEGLGMPRDLNGDSIVDELDHASDCMLLPVRVELEWQGLYGPRALSVSVLLADFRRT